MHRIEAIFNSPGVSLVASRIFDHIPPEAGVLSDPKAGKSAIDAVWYDLVDNGHSREQADVIIGVAIDGIRQAKRTMRGLTLSDFMRQEGETPYV